MKNRIHYSVKFIPGETAVPADRVSIAAPEGMIKEETK